ncbi:aldolase/citrate lyase family protein [Corticibacterium sp. UT-5YL-CI-8]|nr:aldolase/citrate lyase family protein [Tianweitania sp. UT-5YL-CI-8]
MLEASAAFRDRCRKGEIVAGTFQKTPSPQISEVLALSGIDFVILDAEHAPFGIEAIDHILGVTASRGFPVLVRVPDHRAAFIGVCLDAGAAGIVLPHVVDRRTAEAAVAAARFAKDGRGLSPSGRAGNYGGAALGDFMEASNRAVSLWCQIEDRDAIDRLDEICAVEGIDALFVGRADLMRSLGAGSMLDPAVERASERVAEAGQRAGKALAIMIASPEEAPRWRALGYSIFIVGTEQAMLKSAARAAKAAFV